MTENVWKWGKRAAGVGKMRAAVCEHHEGRTLAALGQLGIEPTTTALP